MEKVGKKQWNSNLDIFRNILPPMTLNEIFVATDHERIWLSYLPPISLSCLVLPLPLEKYIRGCRLLHKYCISWNWPARTILIFMWICYWIHSINLCEFYLFGCIFQEPNFKHDTFFCMLFSTNNLFSKIPLSCQGKRKKEAKRKGSRRKKIRHIL